MEKTLQNIDTADIVPLVMARPIFMVPPIKDDRPLFAYVDPYSAQLHVVAEQLTISPWAKESDAPGRMVVLKLGSAIFVGPQLLGKFRDTGEYCDLPDRLFDVLDRLIDHELEGGNRSRWLRSPPIQHIV